MPFCNKTLGRASLSGGLRWRLATAPAPSMTGSVGRFGATWEYDPHRLSQRVFSRPLLRSPTCPRLGAEFVRSA